MKAREAQGAYLNGRKPALPAGTPITYRQWLRLPADGFRYELVEGRLEVSPPPALLHQYVSKRIQRFLQLAEDRGLGVFWDAPFELRLPTGDAVQPDFVFINLANKPIFDRKRVQGIPDLAVEILSPSNRGYDLVRKKGRYALAGIPNYGVVDPEKMRLLTFRLEKGTYPEEAESFGQEDRVTTLLFPGLVLDLTEMWWPEEETGDG